MKLRIAERSGFDALLAALPDRGARRQTNIYFDTRDRSLMRAGDSVRVRLEESRILLTIKRAPVASAGVIESSEYESELPSSLWSEIADGKAPLSSAARLRPILEDVLAGESVSEIGRLENTRHLREGPGGVLYEIDETRFPWGETHFELEIETEGAVAELARARALLDRLGVAYDDAVSTKQARLLRGLGGAD
ncbi:MAG: CYTH domain-containing protein [bacterium]